MHANRRDYGFTIIELSVTMVLAGILTATATWSFANYQRSTDHSDTATEVRAALRNAGGRALSEGRTYCIHFQPATRTYTTYRSNCTVAANRVATAQTASGKINLAAVAFPAPAVAIPNQTTACPQANACAYFYPRGNATAGTLDVTRSSGGAKTYRITVEGLTSRVSIT